MSKPFVKWAGGKRKLVPHILELIPNNINTYYEPFLGGGAVFFALAEKKLFQHAVINDLNSELIDTYNVVKFDTLNLIQRLKILQQKYLQNPESTFLEERAKKPQELILLDRAARFLFLNKSCFNGLFRVNKSGQFNVPWGKYKNPDLAQEDNLKECSLLLEKASLLALDFEEAVRPSKCGDFVYIDSPYIPLSKTSSFTSYTKDGFGEAEHIRLANCAKSLLNRNVSVILSNSDTDLVRELYKDFKIIEVKMARNINSDGAKRGKISELLIVG